MTRKTIDARAGEALQVARQLQKQGKNWLEANNALFGPNGTCAPLFPTKAERVAFAKTENFRQMNDILNQLPEPPAQEASPAEAPSGNLHVRLPRSLHAALRAEADAEDISLNQLIVAKLSMQLRTLAQAGSEP